MPIFQVCEDNELYRQSYGNYFADNFEAELSKRYK